MTNEFTGLDRLAVDTIRALSIDAIQQANSGHPGLPMGAAPMAYVLWQRHLRHNPADPSWPDRDRFVLSAGHGSMLLYSLLHLTGYDLPLEEIQRFRQWDSLTPGHPEVHLTPGVEATTGPLGQGTANAIGMAMAERFLAGRYNRPGHTVCDHRTFALVSDGDLMEGLSSEAASLAGHLGLGKLIYLYDANGICLDGPTDDCFTEDVGKRFEAFGWQVLEVADGDNDLAGLDAAIEAAKADEARPSLIVVRTTIGFGSPAKAGSSAAHGAPLGPDEVRATKVALGYPSEEPFHIPTDVAGHMRTALERGGKHQAEWTRRFEGWSKAQPELAAEWKRAMNGELPSGWDDALVPNDPGSSIATRSASGSALNAIAPKVPWLIGGDADLSCSTKSAMKDESWSTKDDDAARNVHFGVREHAMAAIANGMAYHGGVRPYASTFFVFSDYMRPSIRLAAMNHLPVVYVFTHDSIAVGEDGPTHQPIEHLMALRAMPGLVVLRPADADETAEAWRVAVERHEGPTALVLTRQNLPVLEGTGRGLRRGAYVVAEADGGSPEAVCVATGSEVSLALEARERLAGEGVRVRVVSMPSWELFEAEAESYRDSVLPPDVPRVSIEAGVTFGWQRWVAPGASIGIDRYGASAPGEVVQRELGMTAENVANRVKSELARVSTVG